MLNFDDEDYEEENYLQTDEAGVNAAFLEDQDLDNARDDEMVRD